MEPYTNSYATRWALHSFPATNMRPYPWESLAPVYSQQPVSGSNLVRVWKSLMVSSILFPSPDPERIITRQRIIMGLRIIMSNAFCVLKSAVFMVILVEILRSGLLCLHVLAPRTTYLIATNAY